MTEQRASASEHLRYEDIAQDGSLLLTSIPHFLGLLVFAPLLAKDEATRTAARSGIFPILSRMIIEGGEGPISVGKRVAGEGGFRLAHTVDGQGQVNRLLMEVFAELQAPRARTHGPPPPGAGENIPVGKVFGEHVFTRLFAPPEERKVTALVDGSVPPDLRPWREPSAVVELPEGAQWLDEEAPDEATLVFGLGHTDSNQHVNSLVYPRLFEDAAIRRLHRLGKSTKVLARFVEIAYRKPCFAGQAMRIGLRAYQRDGRLGMTGAFRPAGDPTSRPHTLLRMELA